jgi:hypothetical protein
VRVFDLAARQIVGKRLTWAEVIGKVGKTAVNEDSHFYRVGLKKRRFDPRFGFGLGRFGFMAARLRCSSTRSFDDCPVRTVISFVSNI